MTTIEDRLRDLGRTVTPPPLPGATAVMHRARQRRRRRRGGLAAIAIAASGGSAFAGRALFAADGDPTVRTTAATPSDDGSAPAESMPPPTSTSPTCTDPMTTETNYVVVPDVVGLRVDEARTIMEDLGFLVTVVGGEDDAALTVSQAPAPGIAAALGTEIRLGAG